MRLWMTSAGLAESIRHYAGAACNIIVPLAGAFEQATAYSDYH